MLPIDPATAIFEGLSGEADSLDYLRIESFAECQRVTKNIMSPLL